MPDIDSSNLWPISHSLLARRLLWRISINNMIFRLFTIKTGSHGCDLCSTEEVAMAGILTNSGVSAICSSAKHNSFIKFVPNN